MALGTALVTGTAQGIGRAIATRLAKDGFHIVLNDLPSRRSDVERLRSEIESQSINGRPTVKVSVHLGDVSVEQEVSQMVEQAVAETGSLDVVCNGSPRRISRYDL